MKTYEESLDEMIDVVTKLVWNYTAFSGLFKKGEAYLGARLRHQEFFLTMYDSMFSSFCMSTRILFNANPDQDSLTNLINYVEVQKQNPSLAQKLNAKIANHEPSIKVLRNMRNKAFGHRNKSHTQDEVWSKYKPSFNMMTEVKDLALFVILELAQEAGGQRKENLESQQLDSSTLQRIADASEHVLQALKHEQK